MFMQAGHLELGGHPRFDPYHIFMQAIPYMVDQARWAAENDSYSWRGFKVGAAVLAVLPSKQETAILTAGNVKSRHRAKVCAEYRALGQARKAGYTTALGIVVVGTTNRQEIAEVTDVETPTLHPCGECRGMFVDDPLVEADTLVVTAGLDIDKYQVHTAAEMTQHYTDGNHTALIDSVRPNFDAWEQRIAMYGFQAMAERALPLSEQRPPSKLAHMALLATSFR